MPTRRVWLQSVLAATGGSLLIAHASGQEPELAWHDVQQWGVEGRAWSDAERQRYFDRFPARAEQTVPAPVWALSRHSAGMLVRFRTNATRIWVDYQLQSAELDMPHMPATGVSGVDLYAEDESGQLRWVEATAPNQQHMRVALAENIDPGQRNYVLYLPLYNGVESLQIGVPRDAEFAGLAPRTDPPLVFYGTSIMHGACASRPGMALPAILGRRFGRPTVNLGFSGNGRMHPPVVDLLAELQAAAFCIDCLPNMGPADVAQRTEPLVQRLRQAQPEAAILLVEDREFTNARFFATHRERHSGNHAALRKAYENLLAAGVKHLHYLPADELLGDDSEATVDGSHPTDLGFLRYADAYENALRVMLG